MNRLGGTESALLILSCLAMIRYQMGTLQPFQNAEFNFAINRFGLRNLDQTVRFQAITKTIFSGI